MDRFAAIVLFLLILPVTARSAPLAPVTLAPVFGDRMVLQRDAPVRVWGSAGAGSNVVVEFAGQHKAAIADDGGHWSVTLEALAASSVPRELIVTAGQAVHLKDVLVGDVWIAAGQSNMEFPLANEAHARTELPRADLPDIRLLNMAFAGQYYFAKPFDAQVIQQLNPNAFYHGAWQPCTPASAKAFSAVAYYFGKEVHEAIRVPVGIINLAVGGSPTEAWIRPAALREDLELHSMLVGNWLENPALEDWCRQRGQENLGQAIRSGITLAQDQTGPNHPFKPGFLWDAGLAQMAGFPIRGVIWYQGESNSLSIRRVQQHETLFRLLVTDWRKQWAIGDFPFLYCQLSSIGTEKYQAQFWPEFRDSQRRMLGELAHVGMAVTSDLGHPTDVHPRNKLEVGHRLALWALAECYGKKLSYSGPLAKSVSRDGATLVVAFDHADGGLQTSNQKEPAGFEIAAKEGEFHPAIVRLTANTVIVTCPGIMEPARVRYGWQPFSAGNLDNHAGLPASTFLLALPQHQ